MANYLGWEITNKGRELLARAMNNETKINITKFKIGAGYNTGNDRELTDLLDKRNEFPINSYERKENGNVEFTFIVSNKTGSGTSTITNSYKITEMGIYAQDDFGTEILYAYNKGTDGDYIPVFNGKNAIDILEKCIIVIDQSANLNVTIDSSNTYITRDSAERNYVKKTDYATENKAGIVTLGTTANTTLEGKRLAEIIGLEFGGNIQDIGNKTKGKFYYDSVTKFYYECLENTNLTYNDSGKFRAISNKPISDKVENLPKFYAKTTNIYFLNDRFTIKIPKSNFIFGILAVSHKTHGWRNKIIFTEGESCFEHVSSVSSQRLVITTDSQNVYLSSQDKNISLFLINSVTFFYYD